jgi:murein L,D-transpeptidase YcbB/YkuD
MGIPAGEVHTAIVERLSVKAPAPLTTDQWKHVGQLYETFGQRPLWIDKTGHQPRVRALLTALASADSDALRLDAYPLAELRAALAAVDSGNPTAGQLADADVLLSSAFAAYGENMLAGQVNPSHVGQSWHIDTQEEKVDSALTLTLRSDDLAAGLVRMRPQDPAYDSLRVALGRYRAIVTNGGWPTISSGPALRRGDGDSRARLAALRARLRLEGYLNDSGTVTQASASNSNNPPPPVEGRAVFDRQLAGAVASFQARHGIVVDSMLGRETVDAMNLPADYRLSQIAANLERYRWLPRELGSRYIVVNVPQFYLHAYDSGQKVLDMKVIVGQEYEDKATPVFSDSMEFVIFRPYWNVTPAIAAKEIFPREAAEPGFLAANDMEVYNDHGREAVRQRPGPRNALGYVKFIFPNDYNIYLHDTPNHSLFHKEVRAFSHGCIRVEKPAELAQWVLGWPANRVAAAMHGSNNHSVDLPQKIPVYIVYFTAYVDDGQLGFGNDLYDRDSRLVAQLRGAAALSPQTMQARAALREMAKG